MRLIALTIVGTALSLAAAGASATKYSASIDGCEAAISERLGLALDSASYDIGKIRSRTQYRDMNFRVSAHDDASPVQNVKVSCRSKTNGEVLAVQFDDATLPNALATQ